jgi:predicted transcriptional regulator
MEVQFTPEQEARLIDIANVTGMHAEDLVKDAALRLLEEDAGFREAMRIGIAEAYSGQFIEEDEMAERLRRMLRS